MPKDYNIAKTGGTCIQCQQPLSPGDQFTAVVRQVNQELQREDYCLDCWSGRQDNDATELLATWRSSIARPKEKRKLFLDDDLLVNFFQRLADDQSEVQVTFRYVLALVLMRKKLLVYDRAERLDDGTEVWKMHFKGGDQTHSVIDPKMDETKIADVSSQLGQILEGQL